MTPIALFVYVRPDHVRRTVEALLENPEARTSDLIVFSDAAKSANQLDAVVAVRDYVAGIQGFRSLTIHHRPNNFGLAQSIIEGVTQVLAEYEQVIVLEDDIVTSPFFLRYMNEALDRYEEDDRVISVHGYVYPNTAQLPEAFFLRGADCWGWATWRRGWALFNPDGQFLLSELKRRRLLKAFDFNGASAYSTMLEGQIKGLNDSWAVRWYASAFLANKLTLYPGRSLVHNIGNDSSGTHCSTNTDFDSAVTSEPISLDGVVVGESEAGKAAVESFFRSKRSLYQKIQARVLPAQIRSRVKRFLKDWMPPRLVNLLRRAQGGNITFEGPFSSWQEAKQQSSGYDSQQILEKVLAATLKVKNGEAVFERDSILFDEIQYSWPVTAALMSAAAHNKGRLSVLDFGGSLGSSYFQNRKFLEDLDGVRWSVIEQPHFVIAGQEHLQDDQLKFYQTIEECLSHEKPNVVLLSSVLQYLQDPYEILNELMACGTSYLIVDRTPFLITGCRDVFKVQITPSSIYSASYPIRLFYKDSFMDLFHRNGLSIVEIFSAIDELDTSAKWQGVTFRKAQTNE